MSKDFHLPHQGNALSRILLFFCCFFLSSFLSIQTVYAQLNGTFTIGGDDADFSDFESAINVLEAEGVSGPVTFKVRAGTYEEQISITTFEGHSCENTVLFEGVDNTQAVLQAPSGSAYAVQLNGVDGIGFRNLGISGSETLFDIHEGSDCITLEENVLRGSFGVLVDARSAAGEESGNRHVYRNNLFVSGTTGIRKVKEGDWNTTDPEMDEGLVIEGNEFRDQQNSGILLTGQHGYILNRNTINLSDGGSGIRVNNSWFGKEIIGNHIDINKGGTGIYTNSAAPARISENRVRVYDGGEGITVSPGRTAEQEILVANNRINVSGYEDSYTSIGAMYGLSVSGSNGHVVKVYYNAVRVSGYEESGRSIAFSANGDPNSLYILNNSFADGSWGKAVAISSSAVAEMDYNNLNKWENQPLFGMWDGQEISTFEEWQNTTGLDAHSISVNPDGDQLHEDFQGAGTFVEEVTTDLVGQSRNNPPSIGAIELGGEPYQLSGTYTIGGNDGDYASFGEAISDLNFRGVVDSVVFKVRPGTYREQLSISNSYGNVTFEGESGDSTDVVLEYAGAYVVHIDGASGFTFRHLTISGTENAVRISGEPNGRASDLTFASNILRTSGTAAVVASHANGRGAINNDHVFRNNLIKGEGTGLHKSHSPATDPRSGNNLTDNGLEISGNIIHTEGAGLQIYNQSDLLIRNNTLFAGQRGIDLANNLIVEEVSGNHITLSGSGAGIRINGVSGGYMPQEIMNNQIILPDGGVGLLFDHSAIASYTPKGLVANNMISVNAVNGSAGIRIVTSGGGLDFYYNSVFLHGDDENSIALHIPVDEGAEDVNLRNNLFVNEAGGYAIFVETDPDYDEQEGIHSSDYNNLFSTGAILAHWKGDNAANLGEWQSLTGFDAHSISVDPEFDAAENLIPANPMLRGAGIALEEVDIDIFGEPRNNSPSIGAVELESETPAVVVNAGQDRTLSLPINSLSLSGTGQVVDGRFVSFRWEKVSGPAVTMSGQQTANLNLSDLEAGEYVFRFTATDNQGRTGSDEVTITIEQGNNIPVVNAGRDKTVTLPTDPVLLSGIAQANGGRFVAFRWEKLSGPSVTMAGERTANVRLSDLQVGEYVLRFSATDDRGVSGSDEMTLRVEGTNQPPVVSAGRDATITTDYGPYYLRGTGYDPDGRFTAFRWEKVSGPDVTMDGQNTANLRISDFVEGEYVFRFSGTDNEGATSTDEMTLRVESSADAGTLVSTTVSAYPNTFQSHINVEIQTEVAEEYQIQVFDMLGKTYYQNSFVPDSYNGATHTIDFSGQNMREGTYLIRIENKEGSFREMLKVVNVH